MSLIDRHLVRTFVPPFFFGLSVTTFLLMIDVLQRYINLFLEKGIRFGVATEVLLLSLGHTFALSIPMATLVGTLMAVGHMASDHEITALKACGVSLYRITRPLFLLGLALTLGMMAYQHWVLPESNHRLRGLLLDIHQQRPAMQIKENTFAEITDEYTMFVRHKDDRSGHLQDVILFQREGRGDTSPDVVVAEWGMLQTVAPGRIQLDLRNGEYHSLPEPTDPLTYHRTKFLRQTFTIDVGTEGAVARSRRRSEREMDVTLLRESIEAERNLAAQGHVEAREIVDRAVGPAYEELGDSPDAFGATREGLEEYRSILNRLERQARALALKGQVIESHRIKANRYAVELHKKFSIPVACLVFVVLGVPLAIVSARGGRGVSVGLSLVAFTVYYLFLSGGEKLADRGRLEPWLGMWAANIVLGTLGVILLYQSVQETRIIRLSLPRWKGRRGRA